MKLISETKKIMTLRLKNIHLTNFGPLSEINWWPLGPINLVIGGNDCGKTFLLKALYSSVRTLEAYKRGDEQRTTAEILAEKLYWTFQPDQKKQIGDLVTKGINTKEQLSCTLQFDDHRFTYQFGKDTTKQITSLENQVPPRSSHSIFLPAQEVLSRQEIILESREKYSSFGFDDTYLDLARALRQSPKDDERDSRFEESRKRLKTIMAGGKVEFDESSRRWQFKKGHQKFSMGITAEGIKKMAILDLLIGNRYLDAHSIVFIDEPESALHPVAISELINIIWLLAKDDPQSKQPGLQFFLASHSYFVVKKLFLIAQENNSSIPVLSADNNQWQYSDLKEEIPENPIINESIRLYKEEVELVLK